MLLHIRVISFSGEWHSMVWIRGHWESVDGQNW